MARAVRKRTAPFHCREMEDFRGQRRNISGGALNPLFFSSDTVELSKIDPSQVAIIQFEWRSWTGDNVKPVAVVG